MPVQEADGIRGFQCQYGRNQQKQGISRCLYFDTCKEHGYPEFCKVFCTHDWYAFGVLRHPSKFIRESTIAEDGTMCHDIIQKVGK